MNEELKLCQYCGDKNGHAVFSRIVYINGDKMIEHGVKCNNCGYIKIRLSTNEVTEK